MMRSVCFVDRVELEFSGNHFSHAITIGDVDNDGVSFPVFTAPPSSKSVCAISTAERAAYRECGRSSGHIQRGKIHKSMEEVLRPGDCMLIISVNMLTLYHNLH